MLFLFALALAVFVLPHPWGLVAVVIAGVLDVAETALFLWWSQRRKAAVGVEALVGKVGVASTSLWPEGQVKVAGELWRARCAAGCEAGTKVVVRAVEGLTLVVEPA
ncbi:MAG TPA: NfeD family protein [Gaiellaceae bacterium]|nr:NfeD family protein [Gaiellaceae bacterium]